uniref:Uncharacterized protein n=1 Tax=Micrurus paraensis TaxID=1970185 RepID=A0A2D4KZY9_9SAUR
MHTILKESVRNCIKRSITNLFNRNREELWNQLEDIIKDECRIASRRTSGTSLIAIQRNYGINLKMLLKMNVEKNDFKNEESKTDVRTNHRIPKKTSQSQQKQKSQMQRFLHLSC